MPNVITENEIEEIGLEYLARLGYGIIHAPDISPDGERPERQYTEVVLINRLRDAIDRLNPTIPHEAREEALKKVLLFCGTNRF